LTFSRFPGVLEEDLEILLDSSTQVPS